MVEKSPIADFPQVYRDWIECVYQEDAWPDEPADIQKEYEAFSQAIEGKYYSAKFITNLAKSFPDDDEHTAAMTRDGEMNLIVLPCMRRDGKRCFLDGQAFDSLDEWAWQETINLNGVSVPDSWKRHLQESPDPKNDKIRRYFLEMRATATEGEWIAEGEKCRFVYSWHMGLQRLTDE